MTQQNATAPIFVLSTSAVPYLWTSRQMASACRDQLRDHGIVTEVHRVGDTSDSAWGVFKSGDDTLMVGQDAVFADLVRADLLPARRFYVGAPVALKAKYGDKYYAANITGESRTMWKVEHEGRVEKFYKEHDFNQRGVYCRAYGDARERWIDLYAMTPDVQKRCDHTRRQDEINAAAKEAAATARKAKDAEQAAYLKTPAGMAETAAKEHFEGALVIVRRAARPTYREARVYLMYGSVELYSVTVRQRADGDYKASREAGREIFNLEATEVQTSGVSGSARKLHNAARAMAKAVAIAEEWDKETGRELDYDASTAQQQPVLVPLPLLPTADTVPNAGLAGLMTIM